MGLILRGRAVSMSVSVTELASLLYFRSIAILSPLRADDRDAAHNGGAYGDYSVRQDDAGHLGASTSQRWIKRNRSYSFTCCFSRMSVDGRICDRTGATTISGNTSVALVILLPSLDSLRFRLSSSSWTLPIECAPRSCSKSLLASQNRPS